MTDTRNNYSNGNPYLQMAPVHSNANGHGSSGTRPLGTICDVLNRCGKRVDDVTRKAEVFADNVWHHLKVSSSFTDAAMARISQGTRVLTEGGRGKVFEQAFGALPGEKLLKSYVCYLSTSSGPVMGTLYISNIRLAFSSDYPFYYYSSSGQQQCMHYKVVVQLDKLRTVNPSSDRMNPFEKYIQVVTTDGYAFWFLGFISYEKALKQLTESVRSPRESPGNVPVDAI